MKKKLNENNNFYDNNLYKIKILLISVCHFMQQNIITYPEAFSLFIQFVWIIEVILSI